MSETKKQPMDRQKAEAKKRVMPADAPESFSAATLEGKGGKAKITVLPFLDWDDDWMVYARISDFRSLAESVLDDENLETWVKIRPSNRQAKAFFDSTDAIGEDLGESDAS